MKKLYLTTISSAALLGLVTFANAQGAGTGSTSTGAASNQCWDVSTNMARDKSQTNAAGSSSGSSGSTVGSTSGASGSGSSTGAAGSGTSSTNSASTRPSGMPNC